MFNGFYPEYNTNGCLITYSLVTRFFVAEVKLRAKVRYFGELPKLTNANNV